MFNNIPATDFSAFSAPIQKIVDLNTAIFTKVFEAQQAAAKKQMSLSQARAKAAMEIKDVEGFTAFVTEQSEIAKSSMQELTESTQVAAKDAKSLLRRSSGYPDRKPGSSSQSCSSSNTCCQKSCLITAPLLLKRPYPQR